jgi:hypothetical protein
LLAKAWHAIKDVFHTYIVRPIFGAPGDPVYCPVSGRIEVRGVDAHSIVSFYPNEAYESNVGIIVKIGSEVKSSAGAAIGVDFYPSGFTTRSEICLVQQVRIIPESDLFTSMSISCSGGECPFPLECSGPECPDIRTYLARALARGNEEISSTGAYAFTWDWLEQPEGGDRGASPVVVEETTVDEESRVRVRGSYNTDSAAPKDGEAVVEAVVTIGN